MLHFYTSWKRQKISGFQTFQGLKKYNIGAKCVNVVQEKSFNSLNEVQCL